MFPLESVLVMLLPGTVEVAVDVDRLHVRYVELVAPFSQTLPSTVVIEGEVVRVGSLDGEPLLSLLQLVRVGDVDSREAVLLLDPLGIGSLVRLLESP